MGRKISVNGLKKKAWNTFSTFIRLRDSDREGVIQCFTCKKKVFWKESDAGHFIGGRSNAVLFSEKGVHAQCRYCNRYLHGAPLEYNDEMISLYGEEEVKKMRLLAKKTIKYSKEDFQKILSHYEDKIKALTFTARNV